ncbi:MAG: hypothetical protein QF411_13925, partial [Planctomycetota bacterium]|nr:hypothetical protein [Planctomycetota bacterium]
AVPLVVRAPAYMAAGERSDLVMTTDIFATVLEVAGVSHGARLHSVSLTAAPDEPELRSVIGEYAGPSAALGEVLTALNPEREIEVLLAPRRTLRMGELRLTAVGGAPPMLHDMAEDPDQRRDIAADHGDLAHRLEVLLQASSAETGGRPVEDSSVEPSSLDEETRRQLEALGYVR